MYALCQLVLMIWMENQSVVERTQVKEVVVEITKQQVVEPKKLIKASK